MGGGYDGTIRIDSKVDTKGFNQGVKQMSGGLGSILGIVGKLGVMLGAAFAVAKVIGFAKASLMAAANLERLQGAAVKTGATFGVTAEEVKRITDEVISLGIQDDIAYKAFTNMARNGLDTALLPALARGAQDLNAFSESGVSSSEVLDTLMNGILTLQTETLRTAGVIVNIDQATRKWALANDIATESVTAEQKQAAVMIAVIEKLKGVEGLYELSQRTAAGQMSSTTRIVNQLMMALGGPFMNALYIVVRTFNQFVIVMTAAIKPGGQLYGMMISLAAAATWVANAFRTAMQFVAGLFGLALPDLQGVATTADEGADALGGAADAAGDLADNTAAAGKAAKGALAPFDELNVLQQADTGGGGGTPPGGGGGGIKPVPFTPVDSGLMDAINAKLAEWKTNLAGLGPLFQPIIDALGRLWTASEPLRETLWAGLKWLWDNILVPFETWNLTVFIPHFLDLLAQASVTLNDILVAAQPALKYLWENFLQPIATWTGGVIISVIDALRDSFKGISDWVKENPGTFTDLITVLGIVAGVWIAVNVAVAIFNFLLAINPIVLIVLAIIGLILALGWLKEHWDDVKKAIENAWAALKLKWENAKQWFVDTVLLPLEKEWKKFWTETVPNAVQTGVDAFKNVFILAANIIIGVLNLVGKGFVAVINAIVGGLNKIKVPKVITDFLKIGEIGINLPTFSFTPIPPIPFAGLATGAVIPPNAAFAAILGDQRAGMNIEAPENLIRKIVREESGGAQEITIRFDGSMSQLIRVLKPYIDKENSRVGNSLAKVAA